jgi:ATP-grasp domain
LLPDTKQVRPCIAKVNHSMGSRGIFVIRDDADEQEFMEFLQETGNPPYVVSEFITIVRNIACHFYIHPNGEIIWIGSSENVRLQDGTWSADSTMDKTQQEELQALQLPGARDVADYCLSLGFFGFCGIDVLMDSEGRGHVVDVNPRVTGTCPALMAFRGMQDTFGFDYGLFRRSTNHAYPGSAAQLLEEVEAHNATHAGKSRIVLFSMSEDSPEKTFLNIGVYGPSLDECEIYLNHFSRLFKVNRATYM